MALKHTVLLFLMDDENQRVLLIHKKRGMGAGKWNGPGGKMAEGESPAEAAIRECSEETGLIPTHLNELGLLEFRFPKDSLKGSWDNLCRVFVSRSWSGNLQAETEECHAFWWPLSQMDYSKFWEDDRYWLPDLLKGKKVHRIYHFDREDRLVREELIL
jgi:8-oxo-dGTP diphosphatase